MLLRNFADTNSYENISAAVTEHRSQVIRKRVSMGLVAAATEHATPGFIWRM